MFAYECQKGFNLKKFVDGVYTGKNFRVKKGEVFFKREDDFRMLGGQVLLINDHMWVEIPEATFKKNFKEIEYTVEVQEEVE